MINVNVSAMNLLKANLFIWSDIKSALFESEWPKINILHAIVSFFDKSNIFFSF
jgi:hypothetical protein